MTAATMERRQEAVLRSQTQKKNKGRSAPANMFSFDDYKTERRDAAKAKMMERRMADQENKAIDALINRWLDEALAAGLAGALINRSRTYWSKREGIALRDMIQWCKNTGRGHVSEARDESGNRIEPDGQKAYRLVLFPNKNQQPKKHEHAVLA